MTVPAARFRVLLPTLALAVFVPATAPAANFSWTSTGGEFDTAGNWTQTGFPDPDGIPDANDVVTFDRGNVTLYPVYFGDLFVPSSDIHPTVDRVVIGTNPLNFVGLYGSTLTVDGTNTSEAARGVVIGSGAGDVAALTSTLATFDTQYATLGSAAGSSGTLNLTSASAGAFSVSGSGATYDLIVGYNGTGTVNVSNGRDVTVADDTVLGQNATGVGNVSVDGNGSTWTNTGDLTVGLAGSGTLSLSAAASLTSANGFLGSSAGSSGVATVTGAGTVWSGSASFYVGYSGNGTLNLTSGGDVIDGSGYVGFNSGSTGEVNVSTVGGGNQTRWVHATDLYVGHSGTGTLNITAGGFVQSDTTFIGHNLQGDGRVTVSGVDSFWTTLGDVYVGNSGAGAVEINGGARAVNGTTYVGNVAGSTGEALVTGAGSEWSISIGAGDLYVGNAGSGTLDVLNNGNVTSTNAYVGNQAGSMGIVTVDGTDSTWTNTGDLYVGNAGQATVNITGGGEVRSGKAYIGYLAGSLGQIQVDGADSNWTVDDYDSPTLGDLVVGSAGEGSLSITSGGSVSCLNGTIAGPGGSNVVVDGVGSLWEVRQYLYYFPTEPEMSFFLGGMLELTTDSELEITNGGRVRSLDGIIGPATIVRVHGADSLWNVANFEIPNIGFDGGTLDIDGVLEVTEAGTVEIGSSVRIGVSNAAALTISNGGEVNGGGSVLVGALNGSSGQVSVDGAGSRWSNTGHLVIAFFGEGTVNVTDGAVVTSGSSDIGINVSSIGHVTVDGTGSTWSNSGELRIGGLGAGTLEILSGGLVDSNVTTVGGFAGSMGLLRVSGPGSALTTAGTLTVGDLGSGRLAIADAATASATQTIVGSLGQVDGDGNIVGDVENSGLVSPGNSPGALDINGDYTQTADGELLIEMATASSYDQLLVAGTATLAGTLQVSSLDGFIPSVGQTFTILTADDVDGNFATEMFPSVPGLEFDVIYNAQSVVLTVLSALPGDYNEDGAVNAADYTVYRNRKAGIGGTTLPNDAGAAGVTIDDYNYWKAHYGETAGSGAGNSLDSATVPEPTSLWLLAFGLSLLVSNCKAVYRPR